MSDEVLHEKTLGLVAEERRISAEVLHHLREISVRRLYAVLRYSSLWDYCVKALKYSEAAAQRRISAMRLIAEVPEVERKIKEGVLSLSTVSQVQSACRTKPLELKKELLASVEGKSKRQVEKIIAAVSPMPVLPERRRALDAKQTEVRFVVSERLDQKLERIKALTSHKNFNPSYAELMEMMADLVLDRIDPEKKKKKTAPSMGAADSTYAPPPAEVATEKCRHKSKGGEDSGQLAQASDQTCYKRVEYVQAPDKSGNERARTAQATIPTRYIPVETKRALFSRAGSRCEYLHPATRRRCEETRCLQIEHIIPYALGGATEASNLEVLCAVHNRLRAIQAGFGAFK